MFPTSKTLHHLNKVTALVEMYGVDIKRIFKKKNARTL